MPQRVNEIPRDKEIIVHCKMGGRSAKAAAFLRQQGYTNVKNLKGGITDWSDKIDPIGAEILRLNLESEI